MSGERCVHFNRAQTLGWFPGVLNRLQKPHSLPDGEVSGQPSQRQLGSLRKCLTEGDVKVVLKTI